MPLEVCTTREEKGANILGNDAARDATNRSTWDLTRINSPIEVMFAFVKVSEYDQCVTREYNQASFLS